MKDANGSKNWTERDLLRMKRKNLIKGYDAAYGNNFVVFDTNQVQYIYLVPVQPENEAAEEDEECDRECADEEHKKWAQSLPEPKHPDRGGNEVMFR